MSTLSQSKTIDGAEYTVTQMTPMKAVTLLAFISKRLGPALSGAVHAAQNAGASSDYTMLADAVGGLLSSVEESDLKRLLDDMIFNKTFVRGEDGKGAHVNSTTFEALFQGKVGAVFKLIGFAFEVNYASFLGDLRVGLASMNLKAPSPLKSPKS